MDEYAQLNTDEDRDVHGVPRGAVVPMTPERASARRRAQEAEARAAEAKAALEAFDRRLLGSEPAAQSDDGAGY